MPPAKTSFLEGEDRLLILIVEDFMVFSRSVKQSLSQHRFIFAKSVEEAIEAYKEYLPDITFLDITLPDGTGFEALKAIREFDKDAYLVMLTGSAQESDVMKSQQEGINGYIIKPPTKTKLEKYVEYYYEFRNKLAVEFADDFSRPAKKKKAVSTQKKNDNVPPAEKATEEDANSQHIELLAKLKVLFIDSFEANRYNVKKELSKKGLQIDVAGNAEEAFEAIKNNYFHLIFIDDNLSDTTGYYLTNRIRHYDRVHKKRSFIVGLGEENKNDSRKWLQAGMNEYIKKPFPVQMLHDFVLKHLDDFFEDYVE